MARNLAIACLIYAVLVVQPGVADDLAIISLRPWLPGIAAVACALAFEGPASLVWAGILGLGVDCQAVERPGVHVIIATLIVSSLNCVRSDNRSQGVIFMGSSIFGATFVWKMAASIVHAFLDRHLFDMTDLGSSACWEGISSASMAILVLVAWRSMMNSIRPQRMSTMPLNNRWSMLTEE